MVRRDGGRGEGIFIGHLFVRYPKMSAFTFGWLADDVEVGGGGVVLSERPLIVVCQILFMVSMSMCAI